MSEGDFTAQISGSVFSLPAEEWDALIAGGNPFVSHAFLAAMEASGSVGGSSGWSPVPITIEGPDGRLAAALPAYLKEHSQGEYVFDHAWADAWHRAGGSYYPKLQIAVPFTPATGPRLLTPHPELHLPLLRAAETLCRQHGLSSAHATFIEPEQVPAFEAAGWLLREDIQFHWENRNYGCFDDFLAELSSRKRKDIRKEREKAQEGVEIRTLTGADLTEEHWDAFWAFYQDTGALNFIGEEALYGRYWGAVVEKPFLHFELCYYQAIDAAIALGLSRVEAGAQGGHKLARGYEPVRTVSAHYIVHEGLRAAIADYLEQERAGIAQDQIWLGDRTPFRKI